MTTKTLIISDIKNQRKLEEGLRKLSFNVDQIVCLGDLLDRTWAQKIDWLNQGMERLTVALKKLKEYSSSVIFLPGNTDLRPDLSEDICSKLDVIQLTENVSGEIYGSGLFEGKGYSMISWGPGAGIGGLRGYAQEMELYKRGLTPQSTIKLHTYLDYELVNPLYSGLLFAMTFDEKLKKSRSQKKIIISHIPPYMGNDIKELSNPPATNEKLDEVEISLVANVTYSKPVHTGDVFFREIINKNSDRSGPRFIHSVYCGHIEEGKGESYVNDSYVRNVGAFDKDLFVVEL
jgi:Icc-related predicted phosphoesterase